MNGVVFRLLFRGVSWVVVATKKLRVESSCGRVRGSFWGSMT